MSDTVKDTTRGRGWAYAGAILGGAVSIAANVAHSYVPPAAVAKAIAAAARAGTKAPVWSPHAGAVVGAVFWPVALFVVIEILARVPWPDGRRWWWIRFGGLVPVAVVAAVVSYRHLSGLLHFYGEDGLTVVIGPLAVDGLMVMATGALMATSARRRVERSALAELAARAEQVAALAAERDAAVERAAALEAEQSDGAERIRSAVAEAERLSERLAAEQAERTGVEQRAKAAEREAERARSEVERLRPERSERRADQRERAEQNGGAKRPTLHAVEDEPSPTALTDAAALQEKYGDALPERGAHALVQNEFGWGGSKATAAIKAYRWLRQSGAKRRGGAEGSKPEQSDDAKEQSA